jgi:hypothetical protein
METIMNWSDRGSLRSTLKFHHIQNIYKTLYYIYTDKHDCVYYQKMGQATCFREREIFQVPPYTLLNFVVIPLLKKIKDKRKVY